MAKGRTFSFGSSNGIANLTGFFNDIVIPGINPLPNDLSDVSVSNAALEDNCESCGVVERFYGNLNCSISPDRNTAFLFQQKKIQQFFPVDVENILYGQKN